MDVAPILSKAARVIEMDRKQTRVSACTDKRAKERELQDDTLGLTLGEKDVDNDIRTCPHCNERKNKRSLSRHIKLVHSNSQLARDEHPVANPKIIQQVVPMETIPEEQPVVQVSHCGVQDEDTKNVINCIQGTRKGKKCTDILWVGNVDEEGHFISDKNFRDYFFKYVDKGYQTIMVRATVDVPIHMVCNWVCGFFKSMVLKPEPLNACIASELNITFKGQVQTGQDALSIYPEKTLFLLSKGPLPEQYKNHQGRLWQCTGKCGKAQHQKGDIRDKKCKHKFLFAEDQPSGMGKNSKRDRHIPRTQL